MNEIGEALYEKSGLDVRSEIPTGPGKTAMKKEIENSGSLKEAATKIFAWVYCEFLDKEICTNHQPLINNRNVIKNTKRLIKREELPEVDFGPNFDFETLKELKENVETLDVDNVKVNKIRTANLLARLKRVWPNPEKEDIECRSKIDRFTEEKQSFKNFKKFLKSIISNAGNNTVNRINASDRLYGKIDMNNMDVKKQLKSANPRKNRLLNDRSVLLRQKIKFRIFYTKLDLFRMNIKDIKDPDCEYCRGMERPKKSESLNHLMTECKTLNEIWAFFRDEIKRKWNIEW